MSTSAPRIYFPTNRSNHHVKFDKDKRYRYPFNDKRLTRRVRRILSRLIAKRTSTISRTSRFANEVKATYRFLSNRKVTLAELIHFVTDLEDEDLVGKDLYAFIDASSINLSAGPKGHSARQDWPSEHGVIDDNRSPGFSIVPSLIKDARRGSIIGLGDILIHSRPQAQGTAKEKKAAGKAREKLPLAQKESAIWSQVAASTAESLGEAASVTYIMDQGSDSYVSLATIHQQTGRDFIARIRHDRQASLIVGEPTRSLSELLENHHPDDTRVESIKGLNHYGKSSGKIVRRKPRQARLHLKFLEVHLNVPDHLLKQSGPTFDQPLRIVQVEEDPTTVPEGEGPISWRFLTTWQVEEVADAWRLVSAYQQRLGYRATLQCA